MAYGEFAKIYDELINEDINYDEMVDCILRICNENNIEFNDYLDYLKNYYGASDEQFAEYQKQKEDEIKKEYLRQKISQFLYENND